jgi:hypothetical protein
MTQPSTNLKDLLASSNTDALRFGLMEALSKNVDYPNIFEATLSKRLSSDRKLKVAKILACSKKPETSTTIIKKYNRDQFTAL